MRRLVLLLLSGVCTKQTDHLLTLGGGGGGGRRSLSFIEPSGFMHACACGDKI